MRGLYTATVLETVSRHFASRRKTGPLDIGKAFDLIAGTSTGGILAAALAAGVPLSRVVGLYREEGPRIFTNPMPSNPVGIGWWVVRNWLRAANTNVHLKKTLEGFFNGETLDGLYQRRGIGLCIPAVRAETHSAKIFKTPHLDRFTRDRHHKISNVCLATSAAPLYLPIAQFDHPEDATQQCSFADGGLWANNPILVGVLEALEIVGTTRRPIEVLSVGTCSVPDSCVILPGKGSWGTFDWRFGAKTTVLSMNAQADGHASMARLLADRLRALGQPITVVRFATRTRSPNEMKHMALDRAHSAALQCLTQAAVDDAETAIRLCDGGGASTHETAMISSIFSNAPVHQQPAESNKPT